MTAAYRLTPKARDGFLRIVSYVEERFGPRIAERVLNDLANAFEHLATNPRTGHRREDLTADDRIRFWSVGPTLMAYRFKPDGIEILFVERGDVDWETMLEKHLA